MYGMINIKVMFRLRILIQMDSSTGSKSNKISQDFKPDATLMGLSFIFCCN